MKSLLTLFVFALSYGGAFAQTPDIPGLELAEGLKEEDLPEITGAFEAVVVASFDQVQGRNNQRLFEYGNGTPENNVFLSQVAGTNDIEFVVYSGRSRSSIQATNAIVRGEIATWIIGVEENGEAFIEKNGLVLVEDTLNIPANIVRNAKYLGRSLFPNDSSLQGYIESVEIFNFDDPLTTSTTTTTTTTPATTTTTTTTTTTPPGPVLRGGVSEDNVPAIVGPFSISVLATFYNVLGGRWQRIFEFGYGVRADSVYLGQIGSTSDIEFGVYVDSQRSFLTATNVIIDNEPAFWAVSVDTDGYGILQKNGNIIAEGQMQVPIDTPRELTYLGRSVNPNYDDLNGSISVFNMQSTPATRPPRTTTTAPGPRNENIPNRDRCPKGTFGLAKPNCTRCDPGTVTTRKGMPSCTPCPDGFKTNRKRSKCKRIKQTAGGCSQLAAPGECAAELQRCKSSADCCNSLTCTAVGNVQVCVIPEVEEKLNGSS